MILADKPLKFLFQQDIWQENLYSLFELGHGQFQQKHIQGFYDCPIFKQIQNIDF